MIIDKTYFQGNLKIPNVQENFVPLGDRGGNQANLDEYIERYEKFVMQHALGYEAWKSFIASFDTNTGDLLPGAEQRWVDLVDGKEYTDNGGNLVKWEGLRYTLGSFKYSLIADYVFSIFLNDVSRTFAGNGMVKEKASTAETFSSIPRIAEAYNGFVVKYQGEAEGEYPVVTQRGGLLSIDYSNRLYSQGEVSMYRFLTENSDDYADVKFRFFELTNSFGI